MSEEEAMKVFYNYINAIDTYGTIDEKCCNNLYKPAKILLNLIKKQQEELEKKDKIIDETINCIIELKPGDFIKEKNEKIRYKLNDRKELKQYFEKKVEK